MAQILANIVAIYLVIMILRAVLSWFPVRGGTFLATVNNLLFELTEPVLRPVRKVIPLVAAPAEPPAPPEPEQPIEAVVHARPPGFCTGCPERPIFSAMKLVERELGPHHVSADIGCHLFSILPPFHLPCSYRAALRRR